MMFPNGKLRWLLLLAACFTASAGAGPAAAEQADLWRRDHRLIDLHQHVSCTTQHLARAVRIMDAVGLGVVVNLSGGFVTPGKDGGPSEFERNKALAGERPGENGRVQYGSANHGVERSGR